MQTLTSLFNQALSAIGSEPNVTDPEANTKSTAVLKLWYPVARHAVLTAFHWPSVRMTKRLSRALERDVDAAWANADPAPGFMYAYSMPMGLVQPQYMSNYQRFSIGRVGPERLIFSNDPQPILHYTADEANPSNWEPDLYRCVLWALAASINTAKSGKMAITQKLENQVVELISGAVETAANADDTYFEAAPSFYSNTGYSIPDTSTRFFYPTSTYRVGELLT